MLNTSVSYSCSTFVDIEDAVESYWGATRFFTSTSRDGGLCAYLHVAFVREAGISGFSYAHLILDRDMFSRYLTGAMTPAEVKSVVESLCWEPKESAASFYACQIASGALFPYLETRECDSHDVESFLCAAESAEQKLKWSDGFFARVSA